jgi:diacylglycerol kinase (ATP)
MSHRPPFVPNPRRRFLYSRWFSLRAALSGVRYTLRTQPNTWLELTACAVVVGAGWRFGVTRVEWALLAAVICLIFALEAVNTSIEAVVDLVSPEFHPLAKIAKDAAAGALVFAVLGSLVVAGLIFGPHLVALVR